MRVWGGEHLVKTRTGSVLSGEGWRWTDGGQGMEVLLEPEHVVFLVVRVWGGGHPVRTRTGSVLSGEGLGKENVLLKTVSVFSGEELRDIYRSSSCRWKSSGRRSCSRSGRRYSSSAQGTASAGSGCLGLGPK